MIEILGRKIWEAREIAEAEIGIRKDAGGESQGNPNGNMSSDS